MFLTQQDFAGLFCIVNAVFHLGMVNLGVKGSVCCCMIRGKQVNLTDANLMDSNINRQSPHLIMATPRIVFCKGYSSMEFQPCAFLCGRRKLTGKGRSSHISHT